MDNPLKRFDVVVGAGYVGLVTGATLSHLGHRVSCVDRDGERISALRACADRRVANVSMGDQEST